MLTLPARSADFEVVDEGGGVFLVELVLDPGEVVVATAVAIAVPDGSTIAADQGYLVPLLFGLGEGFVNPWTFTSSVRLGSAEDEIRASHNFDQAGDSTSGLTASGVLSGGVVTLDHIDRVLGIIPSFRDPAFVPGGLPIARIETGGTPPVVLFGSVFPTLCVPAEGAICNLPEADPAARFNVDIGSRPGFAALGSYAAASGEAGPWNSAGDDVTALVDTQGADTIARVDIPFGSTLGIAGPPPVTDDQLLLFDNLSTLDFGDAWAVDFSGLTAQSYDVYLYAPGNSSVSTGPMTINGVSLPSLPGDRDRGLVGGTSFLVTSVFATDGRIEISGSDTGFSGLAGVQLVPSPEPSGFVVVSLGVLVLASMERRRRDKRPHVTFGRPALRSVLILFLLALLVPAAASAIELREAEVVTGGSPVLQNTGGTVRLKDARIGRLGPIAFLPEPGALWQLGSGVGLLTLLGRRRRSPPGVANEEAR